MNISKIKAHKPVMLDIMKIIMEGRTFILMPRNNSHINMHKANIEVYSFGSKNLYIIKPHFFCI